VLQPLTDLLATIFATLGAALGTGHVVTTVLRGVWDNLAFDALCHLEEDDSRDWRKRCATALLHMTSGLLGSFLVVPAGGSSSAGFGYKGYVGPLLARFSPAKAGFTAGQGSFTAVPGRQHNCSPFALHDTPTPVALKPSTPHSAL
jgi:hypothetical protein